LAHSYPREDKGIGFQLGSSAAWIAEDDTRQALWVLLGAVVFLMLIACVNVANLLLARGTARQREIAVRTALGATRIRLVRFVMMESLLLSGFGAALALALAYGALQIIPALAIHGVPRIEEANLNPWVLGFAMFTALLTGVLAGLAPALQAPRFGVASALREGDRQMGGRRQGRLRAGLVTLEVALSFLLLAGAGLMVRSFNQLTRVNIGFQTERRLMFSVSFPGSYWENGVGKQFMDRLLARLSALPEVEAAGVVSNRPVEGGNPGMTFDSAAHAQTSGGVAPWASWRVVTPGYFRAVGLPLLRGRVFNESDPPVWTMKGQPEPTRRVMISEALARQVFGGQDAVGKHAVLWKGQGNLDAEVVGVVGDSRERGLAAGPALTVYLPYGANALADEFVVHARGNPLGLAQTVRSVVASLDPNIPVADIRSFDEVVSRSVAPQRFRAALVGSFGMLALLLATIGIYGVVSYSMSRRTPEIGLRVALGASGRNILGMTLKEGLRPALLGIAAGAAGAWWLSRYVAALLFNVKPFDPLTYCAVAALLFATAVLACYLPGRRAMSVDPVEALRAE
jgi:putative ABC transport system permease protein